MVYVEGGGCGCWERVGWVREEGWWNGMKIGNVLESMSRENAISSCI